ncbi:MAG: glutamate--tRNA ligase [Anaerolineaceae bacterium]|nr:glutamate--tRNA ligase [Anaerolineaceae bacterium]
MSDKPVRTRFAPSPTGPMHIGNLRQAVFGWLYAKHCGGQFILRIEDTDQKRFVEGSLDYIIGALRWLGLEYDEGPDVGGPYAPYIQSERLKLYQDSVQWLLDNDKAYKCFCTSERLDRVNKEKQARKEPPGYDRHCRTLTADEVAAKEAEGLPYVVRMKMPLEGTTKGHDIILGDVEFPNNTLQDAVILKSDGFPTYHLAHVVDDHYMEITHTTRGQEWLPSFPLHINIWNAFGWEMPQHAHLPLILNPNGQGKLSKRKESFDQSGQRVLIKVSEYIEAGYLSDATFNFLANIGWNFGDDKEIFTVEEAIERFDLKDVNPANAAFPVEKLDWLNGLYIREKAPEALAELLVPVVAEAGLNADPELVGKVAPVAQTRIKTLNEFIGLAGFFFEDWSKFQAPPADMLIQKKMDAAGTKRCLEASITVLEASESFEHNDLYATFKDLAQELDVKNGQLFGTLRVALTGQTISTPTFETMEILGKDESIRRLELALGQFADI